MPIINPTEDQFSNWMAQYYPPQQPSRRLSDLALSPQEQAALMADLQQTQDPENAAIMQQMAQQQAMPPPQAPMVRGNTLSALAQPQAMNTLRSSSGNVIDLNYATPGGSGIAPDGRRTSYDPHVDGPRELSRKQLRDGTIEVIRQYPAQDGFGRQSTKLVREIETPAYLNPAELKRLQYEKLTGEARKANMSPEEEARKVGMVEEAKTAAARKAAEARARIPGTIEYKRASEIQKAAHGAEATKNYAVSQATEVEGAIAGILGVTPQELPELLGNKEGLRKAEGRTEAATGVIDVITPTLLQNTANVEEQTERLRSLAQMMGLTSLRKSGVAPGTITEREWPKFGAQLGNLSLRLGDREFVRELANIYQKAQEMKQAGQLDYEKIVSELSQSGQPQSGQPQQQQMQRPSNAQDQGKVIQDAMDAIQRGAPKEAVMQRLREMGIQ